MRTKRTACSNASRIVSPAPRPQAIALDRVQPVPCVSSVSIRLPSQFAPAAAGRDQRVDDLAAPRHRRPWREGGSHARSTAVRAAQRRELGQVGRDERGDPHQPLEGGDRSRRRRARRRWSRPSPDRRRPAPPAAPSRSATACAISGEPSMPILTASTPMSRQHASICATDHLGRHRHRPRSRRACSAR